MRKARWAGPVVLFVAAGMLTSAVLVVVLGYFGRQAATDAAVDDARTLASVLARSVAEPAIPRGLVTDNAAAVDRFDRTVLSRLLVDNIVRIKLWRGDGTIIYSDKVQLIGRRFPLGDDELQILRAGGSEASVSDLSAPENVYERGSGELLEVYVRIHSPEGQPLLFEAYFPYSEVVAKSQQILSEFRPITIAGVLGFLVLTVPLVWVLARRLDRSAAQRERLLVAAAESSDRERRRIARDLHDGVVQDLAAVSFGLAATARDLPADSEAAHDVTEHAAGVRRGLHALRSLLVEIYPPDLRTQGLRAALTDLVAPAEAAGIDVTLDAKDADLVAEDQIGIVWRVAQEGVRNAMRHGEPRALAVSVRTSGPRRGPARDVTLEIRDDGSGFDPHAPRSQESLGLRGLTDLAAEAGGRLVVDSAPGHGTTLRLEVGAR